MRKFPVAATSYSLMKAAKINGLNPQHYIAGLLAVVNIQDITTTLTYNLVDNTIRARFCAQHRRVCGKRKSGWLTVEISPAGA
jgi:hypothetical protein